MKIQLIIAERRLNLQNIWAEVFNGIQEVVLKEIDLRTLMGLQEVDALLMMGIFAHERYGGIPKPGESQILSTKGEDGMPPWVVTTAPFAAHFSHEPRRAGNRESIVVQDKQLTPEAETYIVFTQV